LPERNRERGIEITSKTIDTRWIGERMVYSVAIDAMISARERTRRKESEQGSIHEQSSF
jgi:hypothetical protein